MQSLENLALMVSKKKQMLIFFFSNEEIIFLLSPLNTCKNKFKKQWYIHDLLDVINNRTKLQLDRIITKFSVKTVWHCCELQWSTLKRWHFPTPHTECVCTERLSVNGKKGSFSSERDLNKKNSHTTFHAYICCGLLVRVSERWKNSFFGRKKNVTQNGYFHFYVVISWRMQSSI